MAAIGVLADGTRYYAPLGRVLERGDRVCCHLCGRWFLSVASHLRAHGWVKADYLAAFGLEHTNALRGAATRKRRAAAMTGRQAVEPAIRAAQDAARERARSGALAAAAAQANRGRPHSIERRRKTRAALSRIDPARQRAANQRRGAEHVQAVAERAARRHGFDCFEAFARDRFDHGASLAAVSRAAGCHKDWLARHLDRLLPGVTPPERAAAARWPMPLDQIEGYLRRRYVDEHASVLAIAAEVGLGRAAVTAALRRHGIAAPHERAAS